ncbi:hypothetical protein TWF718_001489 [Orbilia javanica]|uniref:Uncharacterized protein n=1 Tax=Orbilia javanica TaxID=47235 RepID=A0AAN8RH41_9PEZI
MPPPAFDPPSGPAAFVKKTQKTGVSKPKSQLQLHCPGCTKEFSLPASMISHLEAGSCPSMIDRQDVNYTFATYSEAESLLLSDHRKSLGCLLNHEDFQGKLFQCRGDNCVLTFSVLSALIQHADSGKCNADCGTPRIVDHLRVNVYYQSVLHKVRRMASMGTTTMFVKPLPYPAFDRFLRLSERWGPISYQLVSCLSSAVSNVSLSESDGEGRSFLTFRNPLDMERILNDIGNLATQLRGELQQVQPAQKGGYSDGPGQVLIYLGKTEGAHDPIRFLDDVDRFRKLLQKEFYGPPIQPSGAKFWGP